MWCTGYFSNFKIHRNCLEIWSKSRFWFSKSGVGPGSLQSEQSPTGYWCCWFMNCFLNTFHQICFPSLSPSLVHWNLPEYFVSEWVSRKDPSPSLPLPTFPPRAYFFSPGAGLANSPIAQFVWSWEWGLRVGQSLRTQLPRSFFKVLLPLLSDVSVKRFSGYSSWGRHRDARARGGSKKPAPVQNSPEVKPRKICVPCCVTGIGVHIWLGPSFLIYNKRVRFDHWLSNYFQRNPKSSRRCFGSSRNPTQNKNII